MASPVRTASNHYETLQVPTDATGDEIVEAFASHMRTARMRPDISVVRIAQLSVAYETLRHPAKRRDYDASIGVGKEPSPAPPNSPFIGAPVIARLNRIAEPSPNVPVRPERAEVRSEPRVAAFIAASLREPEGSHQQEAAPVSETKPLSPSERAIEPPMTPVDERLEIEEGRFSIGRTGATLAAGVIGVAILAFSAALPTRNPDRLLPAQAAQAEPGLTVPIPPATTAKDGFVAAGPSAPATVDAVASQRPAPRRARTAPQRNVQPPTWLALNNEQPAAAAAGNEASGPSLPTEAVAQQSSGAPSAAEAPAAATSPAPVTAAVATLPLSNATIARTIERIGYGCGKVVSAAGVEGASGTFNITCSSGDTYRAAPVRGRYRFRRTSNH